METLFKIYEYLYNLDVKIFSRDLHDMPAVTIEVNRKYAIFFDPNAIHSLADETCIVAYAAGYIMTGTTYKVDTPYDLVATHEEQASRWAIQHVVPYDEYIRALQNGICEIWDLAEHFGVNESFIQKVIHYYQMLEQSY